MKNKAKSKQNLKSQVLRSGKKKPVIIMIAFILILITGTIAILTNRTGEMFTSNTPYAEIQEGLFPDTNFEETREVDPDSIDEVALMEAQKGGINVLPETGTSTIQNIVIASSAGLVMQKGNCDPTFITKFMVKQNLVGYIGDTKNYRVLQSVAWEFPANFGKAQGGNVTWRVPKTYFNSFNMGTQNYVIIFDTRINDWVFLTMQLSRPIVLHSLAGSTGSSVSLIVECKDPARMTATPGGPKTPVPSGTITPTRTPTIRPSWSPTPTPSPAPTCLPFCRMP